MNKSAFEKYLKRPEHKGCGCKVCTKHVWLATLKWALRQKSKQSLIVKVLDANKIRAEIREG